MNFIDLDGKDAYYQLLTDKGMSINYLRGIDAWFNLTWGGYRDMVLLAKNLSTGSHTVRVELLQDKNPLSTGNEFRVLCLGSAGNK